MGSTRCSDANDVCRVYGILMQLGIEIALQTEMVEGESRLLPLHFEAHTIAIASCDVYFEACAVPPIPC